MEKNIYEGIRLACFNLSISLMWEKDALTTDKVEDNISELQAMTERFYERAIFYLANTESLVGKQDIVANAIIYMNDAHAMPPLRNNYEWFDYTLASLIELACPNTRINKKNLDFLKNVEEGIKDYRDNAHEEEW